jgi:hypothetical protein
MANGAAAGGAQQIGRYTAPNENFVLIPSHQSRIAVLARSAQKNQRQPAKGGISRAKPLAGCTHGYTGGAFRLICVTLANSGQNSMRRDGRVVDGGGLENIADRLSQDGYQWGRVIGRPIRHIWPEIARSAPRRRADR